MEECLSGGRSEGPKKKDEDLTPPATVVAPAVVLETVAEEPILPTSPRRGEVGGDAAGRGAASPALAEGSRQTEPPLLSYPFPPKPLRPIPLHIRVKLQDGIHGHFHDHDDDWTIDPDRRGTPDGTE